MKFVFEYRVRNDRIENDEQYATKLNCTDFLPE